MKLVGLLLAPLQVPLKLIVLVAFAASAPCQAVGCTLTLAPLCVKVTLGHSSVMVCPSAKDHSSSQPSIEVLPVFLIAMLAPKPPGHWPVLV